jgi:hypothetical protein
MRNLVSWLLGLFSLIFAFPGLIPFLGILNWLALPFVGLGIIVGQMAPQKSGRNFNLVVLLVVIVRMSLGGGIF